MKNSKGPNPLASFVIATRNRREVLLATLQEIHRCGLAADAFEVLLVDNASTDGTSAAVAGQFPTVRVLPLKRNRGSCAKNIAIDQSRGEFIVFLDDDSYPLGDSVQRMMEHFARDPQLGAAVFTVTLPNGSRECSAYPDVFIGCGTGFRRRALIDTGGLPDDFFMQAEEYDLSLRLLAAGWTIQRFDDLHVMHLKTANARRSWRTMRLDVRNNFLVATRYMPAEFLIPLTLDWMGRYRRIAASNGQRAAFAVGLVQGILRALRSGHRRPISAELFQQFTRMRQIECGMRQLGAQSVLLVDYGKNMLAYWVAAQKCGVKIVAIADNRLAGCRRYRGISVVNDAIARRLHFDAAVIANSSPVHAVQRMKQWQRLDPRPIHDLLEIPTKLEALRTKAA